MQVISKISTKTLKAFPKMVIVKDADGKDVSRASGEQTLFRVLGRAVETKTGNSDFGSFTKFIGDFRATVKETGEIFQSSALFLPSSITGILASAVAGAGVGGVEFAFDIGVKPADSAVGYEYTIKTLIETPKDQDPLAKLLAQVEASAPLLAAPAAPAVETAPEETEAKPAAKAKK